jgi:hypothetical protein
VSRLYQLDFHLSHVKALMQQSATSGDTTPASSSTAAMTAVLAPAALVDVILSQVVVSRVHYEFGQRKNPGQALVAVPNMPHRLVILEEDQVALLDISQPVRCV